MRSRDHKCPRRIFRRASNLPMFWISLTSISGMAEEVVLAPTGEDGFFRANAETFDLLLLDLMLPGRNGFEILQTLRTRQVQTPVLILTARDGVEDRVLGLDLGADDYLVKPFALPAILARVRALLRRGRPAELLRLKAGDLELDVMARRVTRGGRVLDVTAREFELLEYLLRHLGHVVSREMLAHDVWKEPRRATPIDNVIDVQVARLRRKVDVDGRERLIHTVRGVGFVLREGEPEASVLRSNDSCAPHRMVRACVDVMMIVYATATFVAIRQEFLEQLDERLHDDVESRKAD